MNLKNLKKGIVFLIAIIALLPIYQPGFSQSIDGEIIQHTNSSDNNVNPIAKERITFQSIPQNFEYNNISCILKDHKAYMWFGTGDGLVRFDGINIYSYEHDQDDTTSLIHNSVNDIIEDSYHNLWIGTSSGLNLYDKEHDNFILIGNINKELKSLNSQHISDLCIDKNSLLWIGTIEDGVYIYDQEKQAFQHFYMNNDSLTIGTNRITCLTLDNENNIWLGTQNGLYLYSDTKNGFTHFLSDDRNPASLSNNNITALAVDLDDNLWIGTRGGGLNRLSKQNGAYSIKRFVSDSRPGNLSNNNILSINTDYRDCIWIGTENGGLNRLFKNSDQFEVFQIEEGSSSSINSNSIWTLYDDFEGRLWIGTANKGINVIDEKFNKFRSYQRNSYDKKSLSDNDVKGFSEDSQGFVWIATDGGGLCKFNPETGQISRIIKNSDQNNYLANNSIQTILTDSDDNLWVGTWAGGVDLLNKRGIRIRNYKLENEEGGGDNNILGLFTDSKRNIWAGTAGCGLFRYNAEKDNFDQIICENQSAILNASSFVTSVLEDAESNYWVGTLNGLVTLNATNEGDFKCTDIPYGKVSNSINSNKINAIVKDSQRRLWFGTLDIGLCLFDKMDSSFISFNIKDGLPSNTIQGIVEDDQGNLWITTNKGLSRFNVDSTNFTNYNREDGLNSNEFYPHACLKTRNGEFFLGGEHGFNVFYPPNIKKNTLIPPVHLTNLLIDNFQAEIGAENSPLSKHILETSEIMLSHNQSSFTIEFIALNYTRSSRNQFSYKLEGFDDDWVYAGYRRSATYTNIKPGEYEFLVKGSNNDGVWNTMPTRLLIHIKPPYWKTWWAYLLYGLIILALTYAAIRIGGERINIIHQLRIEQLGREKEHELNEANIQYFTNISHEFRTPLSLIIAPLESIILDAPIKLKEQLVVIYRNAQRLLHLTNDLMDFRKLEEGKTSLMVNQGEIISFITGISSYFKVNAKRRKIKFSIETDLSDIQAYYDADKLETILLNLLSNAFKYVSEKGEIRIKVELVGFKNVVEEFEIPPESEKRVDQFIKISIIDNGPGISSDDLPFIFDKFYQAGKQKTKKKSGTGIGLALTRGLVELHHGFINASSIPNRETCFMLVLPAQRSSYNEEELISEHISILNNTILMDTPETLMESQSKQPDYTANDKEKADLLVVEDNSELRAFLVKELGKKFNIMQAENGKQGTELALREIPDLIVSDILMPLSSGIELCKNIKTDIRTCHIPVILLTAKTALHDQIEGTEIGADAYITKPFNMQLLFAKINQLIHLRRKLYAQFSQDVYIMPNKMTDNEMDQQFIQKTIDFIVLNIADSSLSVESLATALNLSRSNVYRKLKALTGNTIIEFIRTIRLKQAIKLMETKKHSLAEIAYMTGFTSPAYFTKSFKDHFGSPPSKYLVK